MSVVGSCARPERFMPHPCIPTELTIIGATQVRELLTMPDCIGIIEQTVRTVSKGGAQLPLRIVAPIVGASTANAREADDELVMKSAFFVDYRASALAQAGELLHAAGAAAATHICGEIGQVLEGTVPGRQHAQQITVYKSLEIAAQDLAAAHAVYARARRDARGVRVEV